jgi:hypothetical protein
MTENGLGKREVEHILSNVYEYEHPSSPKTQAELEEDRWNFWVNRDFYNPATFPKGIPQLLVKSHLRYTEGYKLFYFMTANGFDRHEMARLLNTMYTYNHTSNLMKSSSKPEFYNRIYFDLMERELVKPDIHVKCEYEYDY